MEESRLYTAVDGKPEHRQLWANMVGTPAEIREAALWLYLDMRDRQAEAGMVPVADVWIDTRRINPSDEEVEALRRKPLKTLEEVTAKATSTLAPQEVEAPPKTTRRRVSLSFDSDSDLEL